MEEHKFKIGDTVRHKADISPYNSMLVVGCGAMYYGTHSSLIYEVTGVNTSGGVFTQTLPEDLLKGYIQVRPEEYLTPVNGSGS